jgi:hypothetical protein
MIEAFVRPVQSAGSCFVSDLSQRVEQGTPLARTIA